MHLFQIFIEYKSLYLEGLQTTLVLAVCGTFFGIIIGALIASMRIQTVHFSDSKLVKVLKTAARYFAIAYIDIIRGTPMMIQATLFYYGLVANLMDPNVAGIVIISFNTAAYIAEILRSGINALDKGQMEAATSLGLSNYQAMKKVILPQVFKNTLPALLNELIVNVKDSSVLSAIGVTELFFSSKSVASETYSYTESYLIASIIYLIITMFLAKSIGYLVSRKSNNKQQSYPSSQTVEEVM